MDRGVAKCCGCQCRAQHYNEFCNHRSLRYTTANMWNVSIVTGPADVYFGRGQTILLERERIKSDTIKLRRLQHQLKAA